MCALIIGGDKVTTLSNVLKELGVTKINHWDARNKSSACKKIIPQSTECIIMLTSYLNHNAMKHFKKEAKKRDLPVICSKQSASCLYEEYVKIMGIANCDECYAKDGCKKNNGEIK